VLSAIYIKGFKTFARPVRMPLEGGVTAVVGPNGSGKSNITDAVLFALGEQSPGVLSAGSMSELIFSGSETLPAAAAAEVTLVLDNGSGEISLPYREVSVARRISRTGETEYRINGTRARLQDVRAVAGEAGIGRHSILRQGAVDAIVAGGPTACRLALEEAAGLGVFRRLRLSASRRLEKAEAQLDKSRQLEAELANQLRRIESEAAAAREYRALESRFRELALAHLYRVATRETGGLRLRLEDGESRVAELAAREEGLRDEEEALAHRVQELEASLRELEGRLEDLEDGAEELRTESLRADRALFRLEASRGREAERRRSASRLEDEFQRVSRALGSLEGQVGEREAEHATSREESARLRGVLAQAAERRAAAEKERSRLAANLESLRARIARSALTGERSVLSEEELARLAGVTRGLEGSPSGEIVAKLERLRERLEGQVALVGARAEETSRRGGSLAAAIGRSESRVRALQGERPGRAGTRLYEVLRARPGYEVAVEAALGEFGAGVLAENVDEGMRLLSSAERVAIRLDARRMEEDKLPPGKPLVECVEVLDERYAEALERLLGGIYVTDDPEKNAPANGYVAVTREGLRLTRTSLSFRRGGPNGFAREARLSAEIGRLDALKEGPGGALYDLRGGISETSGRLEWVMGAVQNILVLAARTSRARILLAREATRQRTAAEKRREEILERERMTTSLTREARETEVALGEAEKDLKRAEEEISAASSAADAVRATAAGSERMLTQLRAATAEGRKRRARISHQLERAREDSGHATARTARIAELAAQASGRLVSVVRGRRNTLRALRSRTADAHRRASTERTTLARRAADLAGDLAGARASVERLSEDLQRAEASAAEAAEEIRAEWGANLEAARREAERHPPGTDEERGRLARKLKRFGDVNLLALSQEKGLRERYEFVAAQRADAEAAASELNRIILSIDREIEARFSETFERVRGAFGEMVPRMMEGASGILDLSEEGVEVGLRLGRRGWKPLRVLSGGERALLALSFLFGIFLSRPGGGMGAFCVLDEAEAALDDLNLARFLAVVDSHRVNGQYLLVTHQKRTMAAADVLYGVVQDASGASAVVSKRIQGE
jgi:chromosome segregation protein